jgi:hypothetical protein
VDAEQSDTGDAVCGSCGQPGALVRARRLLNAAELKDSESMLGQDEAFHRAHVPLGWRVVDFDQDQVEGLPPDIVPPAG